MKTICSKCANEHEGNYINCFQCNLSFCVRCSGLTLWAYDLFKSGGLDDFQYTCKSCKPTLPTLDNIDRKLTRISEQQEQRIQEIENKMSKIHVETSQRIKSELDNFKENYNQEIDSKKRLIVDQKTSELEGRRRRELNIIIFNLKEGTSTINLENKTYDENNTRMIAEQLGINDLQVETSYRLGKKTYEKTRPFKVILKDRRQRKQLLDNSRHIRDRVSEKFKNVIIVKHHTEEQRLTKKLKRLNRDKEDNKNILVKPPQSEVLPSIVVSPERFSQEVNNPFINKTIRSNPANKPPMEITVHEDETIIGGINKNMSPVNGRQTSNVNFISRPQQCE